MYLSTFLIYWCKLTIPAVSILYHLVALLLIPAITAHIDPTIPSWNYSGYVVNSTSIMAMVILLCCPLCAFCSEKFWIDNCLIMCVNTCIAGHLWLLDIRKVLLSLSKKDDSNIVFTQFRACFLSGLLLFGGVAMHCKITALALLPVLLGWIVLQRWSVCLSGAGSISASSRTVWRDILIHVAVFLSGSVLAYSPWAIAYHVRTHVCFCFVSGLIIACSTIPVDGCRMPGLQRQCCRSLALYGQLSTNHSTTTYRS